MTRRRVTAFVAALAITFVVPSPVWAGEPAHSAPVVTVLNNTALASHVSTATNSDVVVDWSRIVFEAAMTDDGYASFMGPRHQAMMHIAMHDALNAIDPRFDQYAYFGRSNGADPIAAAAKAAHDVLVAVYPAQQATLDAELATWLATVPNGSGKTKALTLGAKAAAAIVTLRQNDGTDVDLLSPNYTPGTQPGDYQFVPPYDFAFAEDLRYATPFGLESPEQFRVPAPPALTSRTYAKAYNEVKSVGAINSTTRTTDQSNYANWWYEPSEIGWPRVARVTTTSEELKLWRSCPDVRAHQHDPLRQLRRGLGFQVPLGLLAALHRDPSRRHGRQPQHRQGRYLAELSRDPAGPGLPLDPQRARRRSGRGPQAVLQDRSCAVLDGITDGAAGEPRPLVQHLHPGGQRERRFARESRHPLPFRDRARQGARPQGGQLHRQPPSPAALTARWRSPHVCMIESLA